MIQPLDLVARSLCTAYKHDHNDLALGARQWESLPQSLNCICLLEPKLRKASATTDSIIDFVILKS